MTLNDPPRPRIGWDYDPNISCDVCGRWQQLQADDGSEEEAVPSLELQAEAAGWRPAGFDWLCPICVAEADLRKQERAIQRARRKRVRPNARYAGLTDEDAAYCAAAWASGVSQKSLAVTFGYKSMPPICRAIGRFIDKYSGRQVTYSTSYQQSAHLFDGATGDERKALVPAALAEFQRRRAEQQEQICDDAQMSVTSGCHSLASGAVAESAICGSVCQVDRDRP